MLSSFPPRLKSPMALGGDMTGHSDKSEISTADGTLPWYSETEIKSEQLYLSERLILLIGIGQTRAFACEFKFKNQVTT